VLADVAAERRHCANRAGADDVIGSLVNVVLDYLLIFGNFGFPKMGIDGAAIATATAFTSIVVMYLVVMIWTQRNSEYCLFSGWRFDRQLCARFLRFGLPNGERKSRRAGVTTGSNRRFQ